MAFSTPDLQVLVIATQLHIQHLIRKLQLVYLNSLLDLLDDHLDVRHAIFVKLITSLMVPFLKTSIAVFNVLMTSSSSGDLPLSFLTSETFCVTESFFQPAVTSSRRELICHRFHQYGHSTRAFPPCERGSDSQTLPSPLLAQSKPLRSGHKFHLPAVGTVLSFMGPFFTFIWHMFHQTFCSPPGCFIVASGEPSAQSCILGCLHDAA